VRLGVGGVVRSGLAVVASEVGQMHRGVELLGYLRITAEGTGSSTSAPPTCKS
jgi:hypothetical protein